MYYTVINKYSFIMNNYRFKIIIFINLFYINIKLCFLLHVKLHSPQYNLKLNFIKMCVIYL